MASEWFRWKGTASELPGGYLRLSLLRDSGKAAAMRSQGSHGEKLLESPK